MINVNGFKAGITFQESNEIFVVLEASHSKQGRGQANVKAKVKNLRTGTIIIKSYTGGYKVQKAHILTKEMNYLYNDNTNIVFMDEQTFEQVEIDLKKVQWELNFLIEGQKTKIKLFGQEILGIELPKNIELKVTSAPNAVKGNTTNNPQKKVTLETGLVIEVPMFIKNDELIMVSSETGKYVGRGNK